MKNRRSTTLIEQVPTRLPGQQQTVDYEKGVADFVEKAFRTKMPVLIDFTMNNETLTKLIRHLRRHATGSIATANQYVYAT
ncbi:MAG TPA: hypothetical protein VFE96_02985 [Candidatus Bathyarchaeia archaeon]|nr:hypothetical protein [Candidatus Bathyarchaeia archaeon]